MIENEERALIRGQMALQAHRKQKSIQDDKENTHIIARQSALEQEKIRASIIAKLPKPIDEVDNIISSKPQKLVTLQNADQFMNTRYHMPETMIDKLSASENVADARKEAEYEQERLKERSNEQKRTEQERKEKARLRGNHALEKELLNGNYNQMLNDLSVLQKADREKRQKELINIPVI
jgi:hypothetical protein